MHNSGSLFTGWPHSPSHLFAPNAKYFVTAGTHEKKRLFDTDEKLDSLLHMLIAEAAAWEWQLEAWAVMSNHYHFVAHAPDDASTLKRFLMSLHSKSAIWLNKADGAPGRKVWFQYRDTCLTYQRSYLARLSYVHLNPVKHGLVKRAEDYRWCSTGWFARNAKPSFYATVMGMKIDRVEVPDDY